MKNYLLVISAFALVLLSACAPATTQTPAATTEPNTPTAEAMMGATPTVQAMMPEATATSEAMMMEGTPTTGAMMQAAPTAETMMPGTGTPEAMGQMPEQMTAPHFAHSSPMQGAVLDQAPEFVHIAFMAPLTSKSSITVMKDSAAVETGKVTFDAQMLSMKVTLPKDSGAGTYVVKYHACYTDQPCADGQFAFHVNGSMGQ